MIPIGKIIRWSIFASKIWLLSACGTPLGPEELRCEGEIQTRKLAAELREIQTKEELQKAIPRLKKRFNKIADLLLEACSFPKEEMELTEAGEVLFIELARLYEMPGGRELVESSQAEALQKLKKAKIGSMR